MRPLTSDTAMTPELITALAEARGRRVEAQRRAAQRRTEREAALTQVLYELLSVVRDLTHAVQPRWPKEGER